jgi:hypothetical protein
MGIKARYLLLLSLAGGAILVGSRNAPPEPLFDTVPGGPAVFGDRPDQVLDEPLAPTGYVGGQRNRVEFDSPLLLPEDGVPRENR